MNKVVFFSAVLRGVSVVLCGASVEWWNVKWSDFCVKWMLMCRC